MSGIGIEFRRIYKRRSVLTSLKGLGYSLATSLTPMLAIILVLMAMYNTLDYATTRYADRELLSVSFTYTFIFSLLINAMFSAPISRYLGDVLFVNAFDDVMPCYYTGMLLTMGGVAVLGGGFMIFTIIRGVDALFALFSFCCLASMTLVFYNMMFISAVKDFKRIAIYYVVGMSVAFVLSHVFSALGLSVLRSIQVSMLIGFVLIASSQLAFLRATFPHNNGSYRKVLGHFKRYKLLLASGFLYTLGLFVHNFAYWFSDLGVAVSGCYVYAPVYDKASFLAMYTNVLAGVLFMSQTQQHFVGRYKEFSDTVNVGRLSDIIITKNRMFRMIDYILQSAVRLQFICAVGLFLVFMVVLPGIGYYGLTMDIYPCLAGGYFTVYIMYDLLMFLNYLEDQRGSFITALLFFSVTLIGSVVARYLAPYAWQGVGLFAGALCGWTYCFFRIKWLEENFDAHVFCTGELVKKTPHSMPDSRVYPKADA